jgi:hypothetical protein
MKTGQGAGLGARPIHGRQADELYAAGLVGEDAGPPTENPPHVLL